MDMTNQEYGRYMSVRRPSPRPCGKTCCGPCDGRADLHRRTGPAESVPRVRAERERRRHRRVGDHHLPGGPFTGLGLFDKLAKHTGRARWYPSPGLPTRWSPGVGIQVQGAGP